jgi:hypothetical protein
MYTPVGTVYILFEIGGGGGMLKWDKYLRSQS